MIGSPQCVSANVGNPEDAVVDQRALDEDTELRPSDCVAGRVPERRPLSEPPAAETEGGREDNLGSDGQTLSLSATLGVELAVLRVSLLLPVREPPPLVLVSALVHAMFNPSSSSA